MFSEDDIDFTPSANTNLASLFSSTTTSPNSGNQSLMYKAPKQPRLKAKHETPTDSDSSSDFRKAKSDNVESKSAEKPRTTNTMDLLAVKTVQVFKMENGSYNSVGRLRAALCGSFTSRYFELLLYRDKSTHACRAAVTKSFKFYVQAKNYAAFYDKSNQLWSIMFESADDVISFCTQIALVKWCFQTESGRSTDILIQNLILGPSDERNAEDGFTVDIFYVAKTINPDFTIGREVANNHNDGQPISVVVGAGWEKGLSGVTVNSKRIIIIPYPLLGSWKPLVADELSLVLQVSVVKVSAGQPQPPIDENFEFLRAGCTGERIDDSVNNKEVPRVCRPSVTGKNAKLGYPPLNLDDTVSLSNYSESESEEDAAVISKTGLSGMKPKNKPIHPQVNKKKGSQFNSPNSRDGSASPQPQQIDSYSGFTHGSLNNMQPLSADSHLSVYLSEMRIQNSEVRIGLGRVTDKVDQVLTKLEPKPVVDLTSIDDKIEKLTEINKQMKNSIFSDFATIESQYKEILSLLKQKADEPRAGDRITKSTALTERSTDSNQLESIATIFESENCELKAILARSTLNNINLQAKILELEHLNKGLKDKLGESSSKETYDLEASTEANLKDELKRKMNAVYHSLKAQFHPDKQYIGKEIHSQLYSTIKCMTLEYLQEEQKGSTNSNIDKQDEPIKNKTESTCGEPIPDAPSIDTTVLKENRKLSTEDEQSLKIDPIDSKQILSEKQ